MRAVREHDVLSFSGDPHRSSLEQQRFPIAPALTAVSKTASAISAAASAFLLAAWLPIAAQAQADNTPPSVPTGLAGTAVSPTQINLSWNPSTDNVAVAGYYVYVDDQWQTPLGPTTATSFQHTGRSPGTNYSYRVSSFDTSFNDSAWTATPVSVTTPPQVRDPLKWPFASTSIWNMPIGSNAVYVPANIPIPSAPDAQGIDWADMPNVDEDIIVLTAGAPLTDVWYNSAAWNNGLDRCKPQLTDPHRLMFQLPMPSDFIVPGGPGTPNSSAVFLKPDGRTLIHTQPFARCVAGDPGTTLTDELAFPPVDLYGDGIRGSHGGSGLSAIGGSIRLGELQPGSQGPRHALKMEFDAAQVLSRCTSPDPGGDCFRWPAVNADFRAETYYGTTANPPAPSAMKMGALLAIPAWVDLSAMDLQSEPGRQLAWTLQNYGAYIVDNTGCQCFNIAAENGPNGSVQAQFATDYPALRPMHQRVKDNTPWSNDLITLIRALYVVDNNDPASIGGGGTPRQLLAPPIAP